MRLSVCPVSTPVCLYVTLLYCGQTVGWIKMALGTEVGSGPGPIVLNGDQAVPLLGGAGSPQHNVPRPRSTGMPSFVLIHPTVWLQYSNVTYRQTRVDIGQTGQTDRRTDNGLMAQGEPFYKRSPKNVCGGSVRLGLLGRIGIV